MNFLPAVPSSSNQKGNLFVNTLLSQLAPYHFQARFFDLEADIRADSSTYIHDLTLMYRRFRTNGVSSSESPVEFTVLTQSANPWGKPVIAFNGRVVPINRPNLLQGFVYETILHTILSRVRTHFLIHAGVVAYKGQGIILAADSHYGKTTLALELVRRGCEFLSDELAALGRVDRLVYPFPRSLRIRQGTLNLVGFPEAIARAKEWWGKLLLDIEDIRPGSMGQAMPISHIIILRDPAEENEVIPSGSDREIAVFVDRVDEASLTSIQQIEGVTQISVDSRHDYDVIRLHVSRSASVVSQIDALCQERNILVLDVINLPERYPSFKGVPRIKAIPKSQAVIELLRRFQGGHQSALLCEDLGGSSMRLFMELADIIKSANCHQLYVGSLNEMADLVCNLAIS
jgi:hypothetical protein